MTDLSYSMQQFQGLLVGEILMGLQDEAFLPPSAIFSPHFLKIVVEVKASGPPHVIKLWLGVSMEMLPVSTFAPTKPLFVSVKFHRDHKTATKLRRIWPPSVLGMLPDSKHWCLFVLTKQGPLSPMYR